MKRLLSLGLSLLLSTSVALAAYVPNQVGQKNMANSSPVVVASDQSAVPVSGTFWQATQPVSGTFWQATQPVSGTVTSTLSSSTNAGATAKTSDYDSGAGTDTVTSFGIALPASGGAVQGGTSTNPIRIDPTGTTTQPVSGTVTANAGSGTFTVSGTVTSNQGGSNWSQNVAQINGVTPLMGNGATGTGSPRVTIASDNTAFTVNAAESGTWTVQPGNTANTTPWLVAQQPITTGGVSVSKVISAASTNATSVKGSAGQLYMITASNVNAAARYVKLYNKASSPTVGTDVPVLVFLVPGNTAGAGTNITIPDCGIAFGTGIALAITTGVADNDSGAVAANELVVNIGYK